MTDINTLNENYEPRARLDLIPDEFHGRITGIEEKPDTNYPEYNALYLEIAIEDPVAIAKAEGDMFTQKMRGMHVNELLIPSMQEVGVTDTDDLVGKAYVFKKKYVSFEGSNPRWVPTNGGKKAKKVKRTA